MNYNNNLELQKIIFNRKNEFYNFLNQNVKQFDNILFPKLYKNLENECVLIEFRILEHLSFIIKNSILRLGSNWSFTIVCGNLNYNFIKNIVNNLGLEIKIIKININNVTRLSYSIMLLQSSFWKMFKGNNLLIIQEDSIIFDKFRDIYFKYDYIGAPFYNKNIGNGGFSFRKKKVMIEICEIFFDKEKEKYLEIMNQLNNKKKLEYKDYLLEEEIIEDLKFSKILSKYKKYKLPSFEIAKNFSIEKYFINNSFGGHQIWFCVKNMKLFLYNKLKF